MKNLKIYVAMRAVITLSALTAAALMSGCSSNFIQAKSAPVALPGVALKGNIHGGQQPIQGAAIYLYAASTSSYSGDTSNLLTSPVTSDAGGNFNIGGKYSCTSGQQVYIVALGGDPGGGVNTNSALMAALGDCSNLTPSTFISINEVTTVASVYALSPFMSGYANVGSSATNVTGLARAFTNVNKLVDVSTGLAGGPALPAGAAVPVAELYTLADILAACVNSEGGKQGDGSTCGSLFADVTPAGGTVPTDTIGLALALAKNPTLNVNSTYNYAIPTSPFNPRLVSAPIDWTMSISYGGGNLNAPKTTTVDGAGNIWVANSGNNTVTLLSQTGTPVVGSPLTGGSLNAPMAVAIDADGNAWIANRGGNTISAFTSSGGVLSGSPFNGSGTISGPTSIAIDAPGNLWIANSENNTVTELSSTGNYLQQVSSGTTIPSSIAINPK